jgi:hypothetical protein
MGKLNGEWGLDADRATSGSPKVARSVVIELETTRLGLPASESTLYSARRSLALLELRMQLALDNGSPPLTGWNIRADG